MHALDLLCFDERFRFDLPAMEQYALEASAVVLVAERERKLLGFVILTRRGRRGYVSTLDVDPGLRREGLARRLMMAAEAQLVAAGGVAVDLHVFVENEAAVRFYESAGYRRGRRVRNYYGRGLDAWVYGKVLAAAGRE